jgi:dCMP deaminase
LAKKTKYDRLYMDIAIRVGSMSHSQRSKVGCLLVKDGRIISMGWNGMPSGWENDCEYETFFEDSRQLLEKKLVTREEVLHAEMNAIAKLARDGQSSQGATVYITLSPCIDCAKLIHQSGITRLVYIEDYRKTAGLDFLYKANLEIIKMEN